MGIIRFSDEEVFGVDSQEYEVLINGVKEVNTTPGAIIEIGTRRGGSMKMIIDTLVHTNNRGRTVIAIDPYGNIPIECTNLNMSIHNPDRQITGDKSSKDIVSPQKFDYNNDMRNRVIPSLYYYGYNAGMNFNFLTLTDVQYFNRYGDGFPIYDGEEKIEKEYAFAFLDGPHDNKTLDLECEFFVSRMPVGAVIVADDIWMYSHDEIVEQKWLFPNGFEILEKKNIKASYIKTK